MFAVATMELTNNSFVFYAEVNSFGVQYFTFALCTFQLKNQ